MEDSGGRCSCLGCCFFFGSSFGKHHGFKGRHGCADENEGTGLRQTSDPAASWFYALEGRDVWAEDAHPVPHKAKHHAHRTETKRHVTQDKRSTSDEAELMAATEAANAVIYLTKTGKKEFDLEWGIS